MYLPHHEENCVWNQPHLSQSFLKLYTQFLVKNSLALIELDSGREEFLLFHGEAQVAKMTFVLSPHQYVLVSADSINKSWRSSQICVYSPESLMSCFSGHPGAVWEALVTFPFMLSMNVARSFRYVPFISMKHFVALAVITSENRFLIQKLITSRHCICSRCEPEIELVS